MGLWFDITRVATALDILLLVVLGSVWARNYLRFRSKLTIGLSMFAFLLLGENVLKLYFYMLHPMLSDWFYELSTIHHLAFMSLALFEFGALVFLLWVTWD